MNRDPYRTALQEHGSTNTNSYTNTISNTNTFFYFWAYVSTISTVLAELALYRHHIFFFIYDIQRCFICRPSDSTVSEDAVIEPRTVATTASAVRRSNHSARSHPHSARSHPLVELAAPIITFPKRTSIYHHAVWDQFLSHLPPSRTPLFHIGHNL